MTIYINWTEHGSVSAPLAAVTVTGYKSSTSFQNLIAGFGMGMSFQGGGRNKNQTVINDPFS